MKDIQEILIEMDKLSEQIATTLDEEVTDLPILEETIDGGCTACGEGSTAPAQQPTCACATDCPPCNTKVPYCCKVSVPIGFNVSDALTGGASRKLAVNSCLYCFVDPVPCHVDILTDACPPVTALLYPVRVIGCIQYIASLSNVKGTCGINVTADTPPTPLRTDQNATSICCQDSICVNQVVAHQGTPPTQAQSTPKPIACTSLSASLVVSLKDCDCGTAHLNQTQVVTFRGAFTLPTTC